MTDIEQQEEAVEPYVQQGNEYPPGTVVYIVGDHAADSPPPIGTVIGHMESSWREAERRHVLHMDYGQIPDQWVSDFSLLEKVDQKRINQILADHRQKAIDLAAKQAEHEAIEAVHVLERAALEREAQEAELRARIAKAQAEAAAASTEEV